MTQGHPSLKAVRNEMDLCQILCYPCHKVKTAEDKVVIATKKKQQYSKLEGKIWLITALNKLAR